MKKGDVTKKKVVSKKNIPSKKVAPSKKNATKKSSKKPQDKTMGILSHVLGLITGFIGPLIIFAISENDDWAKENAKKALNWQLSLMIYWVVTIVLIFLLIGILFIPVLVVLGIVFPIIAAIKANEGEIWDYPLTIPFLK